jgi:Na+/H+ antiporter NhaD/arsenite permease-like protein
MCFTTAISFWGFTRCGVVVTLLSTALAWVYAWLRYF